ncbi:MAG TPA: hypothetical protein VK781_14320 [Solirubrobacteraceae bacterium]|jgi:hypothetical protein|nr:hypothetical protein [Solirubrobacteraceae bacterium]
MPTPYVAYGLQLHSTFQLPGMARHANGELPELALELCSPEELDAIWSGPGSSSVWRGRLGDGADLTIEQGAGGDTLFTYGDHARYRLDPAAKALHCAPWEAGMHWQRTLLGRVLPNVSIARGYEALHASAVESPAGVVAVAAPSGTGKTTLALELVRRGWPLVCDDVLTLAEEAEEVRAHPGAPHMNVSDDRISSEPIGETLDVFAGERWVSVGDTTGEVQPVCMVCLLDRGSQLSLDAQVLPAGPLPLVPYMLGLKGDAERERRRFSLYATLAASTTLLGLTGGPADPPAKLADRIEQAVADHRPRLATGGVR